MKTRIVKWTFNWLAWFFLFGTGFSFASVTIASDETQLKAAFIFNFIKYITWPDEAEQSSGELKLCILGEKTPNEDLRLISNRKIRSFTLSLEAIDSAENIEICDLIYVTAPSFDRTVIEFARRKAILTIGYGDEFVEKGGIISLFEENNRIRFDINLTQARESHLQISSKLLQLGRKVL